MMLSSKSIWIISVLGCFFAVPLTQAKVAPPADLQFCHGFSAQPSSNSSNSFAYTQVANKFPNESAQRFSPPASSHAIEAFAERDVAPQGYRQRPQQNTWMTEVWRIFQNLWHPLEDRLPPAPLPLVEVRRVYLTSSSETDIKGDRASRWKHLTEWKLHDKQAIFQVWVKGQPILDISDKARAIRIGERLMGVLSESGLDANQIYPHRLQEHVGVRMGDRLLFETHQELNSKRNLDLVAIAWTNNLRLALDAPPLSLVEAQMHLYDVKETEKTLSGLASWYGSFFHGRLTAAGEVYNKYELTAAHRTLPFGTYLKVTNLRNGTATIVRVNDRGPYVEPRILDLSLQAVRCLGGEHEGVLRIKATIVKPDPDMEAVISTFREERL